MGEPVNTTVRQPHAACSSIETTSNCSCWCAASHNLARPQPTQLTPPQQERGALSAQALEQLRSGSKRQAAAGAVDPASLPVEQQLPQIIKLLTSKPLVGSD